MMPAPISTTTSRSIANYSGVTAAHHLRGAAQNTILSAQLRPFPTRSETVTGLRLMHALVIQQLVENTSLFDCETRLHPHGNVGWERVGIAELTNHDIRATREEVGLQGTDARLRGIYDKDAHDAIGDIRGISSLG
jgi:hypothetical protein